MFSFYCRVAKFIICFYSLCACIYIGDYLAYSGELTIPLFPAPQCQFDFELILALMAAINLYIEIYVCTPYIYRAFDSFWVMWDLLFAFFYEFHSLTTFAPQHIIYFFCLLHFVVAFFSFLCVFCQLSDISFNFLMLLCNAHTKGYF